MIDDDDEEEEGPEELSSLVIFSLTGIKPPLCPNWIHGLE
jgi:hypothetical protein